MSIPLSPNERWENGVDHDPRTVKLMDALGKLDGRYGNECDECLRCGGDGDPGEALMYLLDIYFELEETS